MPDAPRVPPDLFAVLTAAAFRDLVAAGLPIDCGELHRLSGGYDHDGGLYDALQRELMELGWVYRIDRDGWTPAWWPLT